MQSNKSRSEERKSEQRDSSHSSDNKRKRRRSESPRRSRSRDRDTYRGDRDYQQRPPADNHRREAPTRDRRPARDGRTSDNGLFVPSLSRPLVPYHQFASMQTRHIANLPQAYERYKEDHQ